MFQHILAPALVLGLAAAAPGQEGLHPSSLASCSGWIADELAKLTSSDAADRDYVGGSVALYGNTALVGAPGDSLSGPGGMYGEGSAYVFARETGGAGTWSEEAKLTASDGLTEASFGEAVALSGDTAVVGAGSDHGAGAYAGAAYVFARDHGGPGAWGEVSKLVGSDTATEDGFGGSVAISRDALVVGAWAEDHWGGYDAGAAYVFERNPSGSGAWAEAAKLVARDAAPNDRFGCAVAISGDTVLVGAYYDDHASGVPGSFDGEGSAYVFRRDQGGAGAFGLVAKLVADDASGSVGYGWRVALAGERALIGGGLVSGFGLAYVFERDRGGANAWSQVEQLVPSDPAHCDAVALFGDTAVIGSQYAAGQVAGSGAAYVFERDAGGRGAWSEVQKLAATDGENWDRFGRSVAVWKDTALVGAHWDDHSDLTDPGAAYVFGRPSTTETYCTAGTSASGCVANVSVAGTASATAGSGFWLIATGVEGLKSGTFLYGANGRMALPWGNGGSYRCVTPPAHRGTLQPGSGTLGACDGAFSEDLNARWCPVCSHPGHNPGPGAAVQAQLWYRDPQNTGDRTSSFSDAVEFAVCP